ncbi:MAG: hypothetical protein JSV88_24740 [Candidatus Aminicenantes bacterium]|nr:MAG: hypothetical protein JSV88_24740 [Candidatus Aminicenantes bacterium]
MTFKTLKLKELEEKQLKEILQNVSTNKQALVVQLPDGEEVIIQPKPLLKPLPILEGYVPKGWKDAIYQ